MVPFEVTHEDRGCKARAGILQASHGQVDTPAFMPVGTAGAIKGIAPDRVKEAGTQIILANTYHLMQRPGVDIVEKIGGLHRFMAWAGPILTDSGGYQIFSLSSLTKVDDNGVEFASHIDGARVYIDAESATLIQNRLGADVIMCFDQCAPFGCEQAELAKAVERTIRWAKRCKDAHKKTGQLLFGIVQGGIDLSLRSYCAKEIVSLDFDGYAIGGLSVGEGHDNMIRTAEHTTPLLPKNKPRYLMGVGMPSDIIAAVGAGIDMFDCVLPTRNGRNAYAFTGTGPLRLRNNEHSDNPGPLEDDCDCYCCRNFTRAAIRHFFTAGEMLGPILTSIHNIRFYQRLLSTIREKIRSNQFANWAKDQLRSYADLYGRQG